MQTLQVQFAELGEPFQVLQAGVAEVCVSMRRFQPVRFPSGHAGWASGRRPWIRVFHSSRGRSRPFKVAGLPSRRW